MADVRRMTIPLRGAWKVPRTKRANRAMEEVKRHVVRHMKVTNEETIWIDETVNHKIWERYAKTSSTNQCCCYSRRRFPIEVKIDDETTRMVLKMGNIRLLYQEQSTSSSRNVP